MQPYAMSITHRNRGLSGSQFLRVRSRLRVRNYGYVLFEVWVQFPFGIPSSLIWKEHKLIPHLRKWVTTFAFTYGTFVYWLGPRSLKPQKVGSKPPSVTRYAYVAQLVGALGSYPNGCWFKSSHRHQ